MSICPEIPGVGTGYFRVLLSYGADILQELSCLGHSGTPRAHGSSAPNASHGIERSRRPPCATGTASKRLSGVPASLSRRADRHPPGRRPIPGTGDGSINESATVQGDPTLISSPRLEPRNKVPVTVQHPARTTGGRTGDPTEKGKNAGGSGSRGAGTRGLPGNGEPGIGRSRISADQVNFRSWSAPSPTQGRTMLLVTLSAQDDVQGDLELITLGAGGAPEPGYELPVLSAQMIIDGKRESVEWEGNVFKAVKLVEGRTARLEIELEAGHGYRLAVK